MSREVITNMGHSVNARLKHLSEKQHQRFDYILLRYAIERFLYRLGQSEHHSRFVLKGASVFAVWCGPVFRVTRDADLHCHGKSNPDLLLQCFRDICRQRVPDDGVSFDVASMTSSEIRKEAKYRGTRITFNAYIDKARVTLLFDVGFGDSVFPEALAQDYPALLDFPCPNVRIYPRCTIVAEKFEAMISVGMLNSRLKDYFDLWLLSEDFDFDHATLRRAIELTFARRGTSLPTGLPVALSDEFANDRMKQSQWMAFMKKVSPSRHPDSLLDCIVRLRDFLLPFYGRNEAPMTTWKATGPWIP